MTRILKLSVKEPRGFTLLEVAIVLLCIGLILAGLLNPLRNRVEARDRQSTESDMADIKDALLGFAVSNGRLPCPDSTNDGIENIDGGDGSCVAPQGSLPSVTLGVRGQDAWGRNYLYRVSLNSANFTDTLPDVPTPYVVTAPCPKPTRASFDLCNVGDIQVLSSAGGALVASQVPAIVVSLGANKVTGVAPASADERENDPDSGAVGNDSTFVSTGYRNANGQEFDDLIVWVPLSILKLKMIEGSRLP